MNAWSVIRNALGVLGVVIVQAGKRLGKPVTPGPDITPIPDDPDRPQPYRPGEKP